MKVFPLLITMGTAKLFCVAVSPESLVVHLEFNEQMVKWRMPGPVGLGDTGTIPYEMDIKLYAHVAVLAGAARTQPSPWKPNGALLFYAVKLRKR